MDKKKDEVINVSNEFNKNECIYNIYDMLGKPKIMNEVFYALDYPIKFKDLYLYPIPVEFNAVFKMLVQCLTLHKNLSGDINAITKKYLDYLFYLLTANKVNYIDGLHQLLLMVLHKSKYAKDDNGDLIYDANHNLIDTIVFVSWENDGHYEIGILKSHIQRCNGILKDNYIWINAEEFDELRKLICEQNNVDFLGDDIHPDKLEKIKEYDEYIAKKNKDKICNFEEQIAIMIAYTGLSKDRIVQMSIRTFEYTFERIAILINYFVGELLSPMMKEQDAKKIKSWVAHLPKKNKLDEISQSYDEFSKKFEGKPQQKDLV